MSDLYQAGLIATLHRLGQPNLERLEQALAATPRPIPSRLSCPASTPNCRGPCSAGL